MKIPKKGPNINEMIQKLITKNSTEKLMEILNKIGPVDNKNRYLHWDELRFKPLPHDNFTHEEWWLGMKMARNQLQRKINFIDTHNKKFSFCLTDSILKDLHWLNQQMAGNLTTSSHENQFSSVLSNEDTKKKYILNSLIEEAISSSQLEGATTTGSVAKEMLRNKRTPKDTSEQMIYNNYLAMQFIKSIRDQDLTEEIIFEIHKLITKETLDDPKKAGTFRTNADKTVVQDMYGEVLHFPPNAEELPQRLKRLVKFANHNDQKTFIHPIIKAIILHFMIGYDHPFTDGNGRTARALFYWYMIRHGYWMGEYVSISEYLKKSPKAYGLAYLHTEYDDNDTTYFIVHQLNILKKASQSSIDYIIKKHKENKEFSNLFPILEQKLNTRQLSIIKRSLVNPQEKFKIKTHQSYFGIAYQTARTDLMSIAEKFELLEMQTIGKSFVFTVPKNLKERIKKLDK